MRMHGHAEHDPADYVVKELYAEYVKKDPVELFENVLVSGGVLDADTAKKICERARPAAIVARRSAVATGWPSRAGSRSTCMPLTARRPTEACGADPPGRSDLGQDLTVVDIRATPRAPSRSMGTVRRRTRCPYVVWFGEVDPALAPRLGGKCAG